MVAVESRRGTQSMGAHPRLTCRNGCQRALMNGQPTFPPWPSRETVDYRTLARGFDGAVPQDDRVLVPAVSISCCLGIASIANKHAAATISHCPQRQRILTLFRILVFSCQPHLLDDIRNWN